MTPVGWYNTRLELLLHILLYDLDGVHYNGNVTIFENSKVSPGVTGFYDVTMGTLGTAEFDVQLTAAEFKAGLGCT